MATVRSQVKLPSVLGRPLHVAEAESDLTLLAQSIDDILTITLLQGLTISGGAITASDTLLTALGKLQNEINNIITITQLTGLSTTTGGTIVETDTILKAFGRLQNSITNILTNTSLTGLTTAAPGPITSSDNILSAFGRAQYQFNDALNKVLTGINTSLTGAVTATDSILTAFGRIQNRLTNILATTLSGFSAASGGTVTSADTILTALQKLEYRTALNDAKTTYPGLPTLEQIDARSSQDYIQGLELYYVDGTHIGVTAGSAYIQSSSSIVSLGSDTSTLVSGIAANTNYHVYLTSGGTVEISTTAPATTPYFNTARSKNADTTRRYLGTCRSTAGSVIIPFHSISDGHNLLDIGINYGAIVTGVTTDDTTVRNGDFSIPLFGAQVLYLMVSGVVTLAAADDLWQTIKLGPMLTATENPGGATFDGGVRTTSGYAGAFRTPIYKVNRTRGATTIGYSRQTLSGTTGKSLAFHVHGLGLVR